MDEQLLTVDDLARLLNVPKRAVYDMRYDGELPPAVLIGSQRLRWRPADVRAWLEARPTTDTSSRRAPVGTTHAAR